MSDELRYKEPGRAPEPNIPRMGRPPGACGLRESEQELCYEQVFGRKIRVDQDTYKGLGRAGDVRSGSFGPTPRPEDDPTFFKSLKDTPTFTRFCSSLKTPPAVSPHERRAAAARRNAEKDVDKDRSLVASLDLPVPPGYED